MKLLFISLLVSLTSFGQSEKALKFKVVFQDFQVAAEGGGWTDWKELGNMNKEIDQNITINFTNKTIATDFKLEGAKREFYTYKIVGIENDKTYEDFGFYASIMKVDEGDGNIKIYRLIYSNCDNKYVLIVYATTVKTRYKLKEI